MKHRKLAALLVLCAVFFSACSMKGAVQKMSVELKTVQVNNMTFTGFDADVSLKVTNPNWFTVGISDLDYHAFVSGQEVASGKQEKDIELPSGSAVTIDLPVKVDYGSLSGKMMQALLKGKLEYRLVGSAVFHTWFASRTVPFDTKEKKFKEIER